MKPQGRRKQFPIGQANSGQFFEYVGKVQHACTHRHTVCSYCTISIQRMLNTRALGHAPQENLKKTDALRLNLQSFQGLK